MSVMVTEEQKQALEATGYGISGTIGGLPRQTYWTPDGRVVRLVANNRQYVRKDANGKVIESGTRDANLDKGLLTSPPQVKKVFCPTCDRWHDDKAGVTACKRKQDALMAQMERKARKELKKETPAPTNDERVIALEDELKQMREAIAKLTGGKENRKILQRQTDEQKGPTRPVGTAKERIQ